MSTSSRRSTPSRRSSHPAESSIEEFANRPLADIPEEIFKLRELSTSLRRRNDELNDTNHVSMRHNCQLAETNVRLATTVARQDAALQAQKSSRPALSLPHELLMIIFRYALPPPYQHDPSVAVGPRNSWLESIRTKKACALVCRGWTAPAAEVLYQDVVFRRMGQICALADTFRAANSFQTPGRALSGLVRSIRMDSCVVWAPCAKVVREDLELVLRQCTRLRSFSFHPHPSFPVFTWPSILRSDWGFNPSWVLDPTPGAVGGLLVERLVTGLQSLDLDLRVPLSESSFGSMMFMLSNAAHLTSLTLRRVSHLSVSKRELFPHIVLPQLTKLRIHLGHEVLSEYVSTRWQMPKLTSLMMVGCPIVPMTFLRAQGTKLTYLHFDDGWTDGTAVRLLYGANLLPRLHELCPVLEHLVLRITEGDYPALYVISPTLRYLDIISGTWFTIEQYRTLGLAPNSVVPNLQNVRLVMMPESTPYFPQICHPSLLLPNGTGPFTDFSHVPLPPDDDATSDGESTSDEEHAGNQDAAKKNEADSLEFTTGGIVYDFPLARLRQKSWLVTHDPQLDGYPRFLPASHPLLDDSEPDYVPSNEATASQDEASEDDSCSESDLSSGEEESDLEMDISNTDGPYDRDTVLRMFRAGLDSDYLFD
ncbi:hypothetical protein K466DRAFT_654239 [Polyporus arcularius HHB13444]|uniref:Uncharacterized protein n=1 Tax=Polyporus arcularius HHB13444 TaxID=1314778 RepID=A0A5C3P730_9APHY|nr:hypothetical protein K466DRAFT_654239 [Polyporus arcularius HHB13444]